ncbi:S-adenosyl-l-methionine hydroxide adenosyltransferase family protein [Chloroflexota bacterium]
MGSVITLTTDFGTEDAYVAVMKGVILGINPWAGMVDICHTIEPQNISQAAFVISTAYEYFSHGTIHMVVVDPGVGGRRRAVILKTPGAFFVAPDNGILSYIISALKEEIPSSQESPSGAEFEELPPGLQAVNITNPEFWHHPVSSTFHGRDIFAPVSAYLSLGVPMEEFGDGINTVLTLPVPYPRTGEGGELVGHIIHIDRFGNLITDIKKEDLPSDKPSLEITGHVIESLSTSYSDGDKLRALLGSSGHLEIALRNGSAAGFLGARIGDEVIITDG